MVYSPALQAFPWLRHGFTSRAGGRSTVYCSEGGSEADLNLGFTPHDDPALVRQNRASVLHTLHSTAGMQLVTARQVHGTAILPVRRPSSPPDDLSGPVGEADALTTADAGLLLAIQVADCVPVLLADSRLRAVAAIHAGWRGTCAGIVQAAVISMGSTYGSHPRDLIAAIGPSIGPCCYNVGEELRVAFLSRFPYAEDLFTRQADGLCLDLWQANRRQLLDAGLHPLRVEIADECTACALAAGRRKYFSHRAEQGFTGRAMGVIGISTPEPSPWHAAAP